MFVRIEKESENITKTLQNYFFSFRYSFGLRKYSQKTAGK